MNNFSRNELLLALYKAICTPNKTLFYVGNVRLIINEIKNRKHKIINAIQKIRKHQQQRFFWYDTNIFQASFTGKKNA